MNIVNLITTLVGVIAAWIAYKQVIIGIKVSNPVTFLNLNNITYNGLKPKFEISNIGPAHALNVKVTIERGKTIDSNFNITLDELIELEGPRVIIIKDKAIYESDESIDICIDEHSLIVVSYENATGFRTEQTWKIKNYKFELIESRNLA